VLQALIVVTGIALADSVNPSTVGPGLVLAVAEHPTRRVLVFTAGAFAANFIAGALLVLGPGHWLLALLPSLSKHTRHVGEVLGGILIVAAALIVWLQRKRLAGRELPGTNVGRGRTFTAGATVMLVEFPTALPYFAAIAAVVGLDKPLPVELALVAWFNVVFLWPLFAIAVAVHFSANVRRSVVRPAGDWLRYRWPTVFAVLLAVVGLGVIAVGVVGLAG